jgi:predicted alpha/beta hydrolase family esterase
MIGMKKPTIFNVPGLYDSGPAHWQTHWEKEHGLRRIVQKEWEHPVCEEWICNVDDAIAPYIAEGVILVGHSLGCCTIVRWAEKFQRIIRGALLVGPSDVEAPSYPPGTSGFSPMPVFRLPFPSIVIASSNDPYVTLQRAREFAVNWGSQFVDCGPIGHINSDSNLGNWAVGYSFLENLLS